jgi:hypothetical protein
MYKLTQTEELLDTIKLALLGNFEHPLVTVESYEEHGYRGSMWRVNYLAENIPKKCWIFYCHDNVPILTADVVPIHPDHSRQSAIFYGFCRDISPGLQEIVTDTIKKYAAENGIDKIIPEAERKEAYPFFQEV